MCIRDSYGEETVLNDATSVAGTETQPGAGERVAFIAATDCGEQHPLLEWSQ